MIHKIALNGFGAIGHNISRIILSGSDCYKTITPEKPVTNVPTDIKIFEKYTSLTDIYKAVKRKYNPDTDIFKTK